MRVGPRVLRLWCAQPKHFAADFAEHPPPLQLGPRLQNAAPAPVCADQKASDQACASPLQKTNVTFHVPPAIADEKAMSLEKAWTEGDGTNAVPSP